MITSVVTFEGVTPFSSSKLIEVPKNGKENPDDYERRTWKERCHFYDSKGNLVDSSVADSVYGHPSMAWKHGLVAAAKYDTEKLKGNETVTKLFVSGVMPQIDPILFGTHPGDIEGEELFVPAQPGKGKQGTGTRVKKIFPLLRKWGGKITFEIFDERITERLFKKVLENSGMFIGVGRWRPENGGLYGRYKIKNFTWDVS